MENQEHDTGLPHDQSASPTESKTTVQVIVFHPQFKTQVLWLHNLLKITRRGAKQPGWGNAGGGLEGAELEWLKGWNSRHPILTNPRLTDEEKALAACGLREVVYETGYTEITIIPLPDRLPLLDESNKDGHRIITLWGQANSLERIPVQESNEVDKCDWFDIETPLPALFRDRIAHPDLPYYSHVARTIGGILKIDLHRPRTHRIGHLIHPSWKLTLPIGEGDPRFPRQGYRIPRQQWRALLEEMMKSNEDAISLDELYERFRADINRERESRSHDRIHSEERNALPPLFLPKNRSKKVHELLTEQWEKEYGEWAEKHSRSKHS